MIYFEKRGRRNTEETVRAAVTRAKELNIKHLVVASNSGETAEQFLEQELEIVCVTHHVGYKEPGVDEMGAEKRQAPSPYP